MSDLENRTISDTVVEYHVLPHHPAPRPQRTPFWKKLFRFTVGTFAVIGTYKLIDEVVDHFPKHGSSEIILPPLPPTNSTITNLPLAPIFKLADDIARNRYARFFQINTAASPTDESNTLKIQYR